MPAEIVLAVGTEYVEREEAPRLIADALHPSGPYSDALAVFKAACEEEHAAEIGRAISRGEIRMRSPLSFVPAGPLHANALIPVDDLARYAAKLGITVKFQNEMTPIGLIARELPSGNIRQFAGRTGGSASFAMPRANRRRRTIWRDWSNTLDKAHCAR